MFGLGRWLALPAFVVFVVLLAGASPAHATFPGQNGRILFVAEATPGPPQENPIATVNGDGTDLRVLTRGHAPAWSADGRRIAFESFGRIYTIKANGEDRERVGPAEAWAVGPEWSPDGLRLAVKTERGIEVVDIATGRRTLPVMPNFFNHNPTWSPDGRRIAFVSGIQQEIYTVHPDGTGLRNITNSPDEERGGLDWSPDGERLTFSSQGGGPQLCRDGLYTMRADGSDRQGIWVTICGAPGPRPPWITHLPTGEVILPGWNAATGEPAPLVTGPSGPINGFEPVWQPLPEPRRADYKNPSAYCRALRDFLGEDEFAARYRNHGACVSHNR